MRGRLFSRAVTGSIAPPRVTAKLGRRCPKCDAEPYWPCTKKTGSGQMVGGTGGTYVKRLKTLHRER